MISHTNSTHIGNPALLDCCFEFKSLRLNVSPIPVQIVDSRGAPSSYAVLKKFHGLAWWSTALEFVVCVYTYSQQCYASGQLVDRATLQFKPVICVWIAGCQRLLLAVKKMSGQVRWKGRFIKNKTLDYEVRRNSGLVEARKRKYSAGNFKYAFKLLVCVCVCVL